MKKTKKLVLNLAKVRELVGSSLERANGGYLHASDTGSAWCSSSGARKCTYGCNGVSALCHVA